MVQGIVSFFVVGSKTRKNLFVLSQDKSNQSICFIKFSDCVGVHSPCVGGAWRTGHRPLLSHVHTCPSAAYPPSAR